MEILAKIVQPMLDMGPSVFLPIAFFILGMVVHMKPSRAASAGITLGIAFASISLVMNFLTINVGSAAKAFITTNGFSLKALDMGWPAMLGFTWQWSYAFFMFPIQIGINILMLVFGWTKTLNVDMWNVVNKIFTAYIVAAISKSIIIGFIVAAIQVVFELLNSDVIKNQVYKITRVPGVSISHPMLLSNIVIYPFSLLLDKIIPTTKEVDAAALRQKIGVFGENHILGFIVGTAIGFFGGYQVKDAMLVGIQAGTALTLFPMVTKLFMTALAPVSEAANAFVKKRFPGKEIVIGLDWPIIAGNSELWVVAILTIPVIIGLSLVLPGNIVLPLASLTATSCLVPSFILYRGDIVKMLITNIAAVPIFLWVSSYFAPVFTELASSVGKVDNLPAGQMMTQ
jgi:PTS system galactitol-specific IIC component